MDNLMDDGSIVALELSLLTFNTRRKKVGFQMDFFDF